MKIWLDQVREEPCSWDETESIAPETLDRPEVLALGPVRWRGEITYAEPAYLLRGRLSYEQTLACIRCLKPHAVSTSATIDLLVEVEELSPRAAKSRRAQEDAEVELQEADLDTVIVPAGAGGVLDTRSLVIEQLQLNVPMKPLCDPECLGLCPRCGAERNLLPDGECLCAPSATDPRWAALAPLAPMAAAAKPAAPATGGTPETPMAPKAPVAPIAPRAARAPITAGATASKRRRDH
jgi:uncharacterized protein